MCGAVPTIAAKKQAPYTQKVLDAISDGVWESLGSIYRPQVRTPDLGVGVCARVWWGAVQRKWCGCWQRFRTWSHSDTPSKHHIDSTQKTLFSQLVVLLFRERKTKGFTCGSPVARIKGYFGFLQEQGDSLGMLRMVSVNPRLKSRQQWSPATVPGPWAASMPGGRGSPERNSSQTKETC